MPRLSVFLGLLVALAGPAYSQVPAGREAIPTRAALARLGLEKHWSAVVPLSATDEQVAVTNLDSGILFVATNRGLLHALDAETGEYGWGVRLVEGPAKAHPASANSDQVFATAHDTLFCLHRPTGKLMWKVRLEAMPTTATVCDEETVAVGLFSGKIVAYRTRDHSHDVTPGRSAGTFAFAWQTRELVTSAPIITPRLLVFGSHDKRVYVGMPPSSGQPATLLYRFLTGGPIRADLGTAGTRTLIVPSDDQNLYGIDLFSGNALWSVATGAPVDQQPIVSGRDAYAINSAGRLFSIDVQTGALGWETQTKGRSMVAVSPSRVYVATRDHDMLIIDRGTGRVIADARDVAERAGLSIRELSLGFPNTVNDRIYVAGPKGMIYCLREIGQITPVPLRDPALPPFGYIPPEGLESEVEESLPERVSPDHGEPAGAVPAPGDSDDRGDDPPGQ